MKKLLCIFLSVLILIFSSIPVYAETVVDSTWFNFDNLGVYKITESSFNSSVITYINNYVNVLNSKVYIFPTLNKPDGKFEPAFLVVGTTTEINVEDLKTSAGSSYTNYSNVNLIPIDSTITSINSMLGYYRSNLSKWYYSEKSRDFPNSTFYVDLVSFPVEDFLVFNNGNCVSESFCSAEYLGGSDYEEDGVVIKGLTAFFNKMTNLLDSILQTLKNLVSDIIGIPEDGYFAEKIENIKNKINEKYKLDALFGFFEDMQNISSTIPSISYDKDLTVNNVKIPFDFHIDFSWFEGDFKNTIFLLIRAVGYPMLIIYNLNQVYLLFRGRKFFETGGEEE